MARLTQFINEEVQRSTAVAFKTEAERKRYTAASITWGKMYPFLQAKNKVNNPLAYAKMITLELDREGGPRKSILTRLIARYYRIIQEGVQFEVLKKIPVTRKVVNRKRRKLKVRKKKVAVPA